MKTQFVLKLCLVFVSMSVIELTAQVCDYTIDVNQVSVNINQTGIPADYSNGTICVNGLGALFINRNQKFTNVTFIFNGGGQLRLENYNNNTGGVYTYNFTDCTLNGLNNQQWYGISVNNEISILLDNTFIKNAQYGVFSNISTSGNIIPFHLTVKNSHFIDCNVGMYIHNNYTPVYVDNSEFTNTSFTGAKAIDLVTGILIITRTGFSNFNNGITVRQQNNNLVTLKTCTFSNITISALVNNSVFAYFDVSKCTFTNIGLEAIRNVGPVKIIDNKMNECAIGVKLHSYATNSAEPSSFTILRNRMTNVETGITIYQASGTKNSSDGNINNNNISLKNSSGHGIILENTSLSGAAIYVLRDTISGYFNGIILKNSRNVKISGCIVGIKDRNATDSYGIGIMNNSTNCLIRENIVYNTLSDVQCMFNSYSMDNYYCCNNLIGGKTGMLIKGPSGMILRTSNFNYNHLRGLRLDDVASIGSQDHTGNQWNYLPSITYPAYNENINNLNLSRFRVNDNAQENPPKYPQNGWFFPDLTNSVTCLSDLSCGIGWTPRRKIPEGLTPDLDNYVMVNEFQGPYGIEQTDFYRRLIFERYFLYPTLFQQGSNNYNYVINNQESDYYKMAYIQFALMQALEGNTNWQLLSNQTDTMNNYLNDLSEQLDLDFDQAQNIYSETMASMFKNIISNINNSRVSYTSLSNQLLSNLKSYLTEYYPIKLWAQLDKQFYLILIDHLMEGGKIYNSNQINQLLYIASLCPIIGGQAVFNAQSILEEIDNVVIPYATNCSSNNELKQSNVKTNNSYLDINELELLIDSNPLEQVMVIDLYGRVIFQGNARELNLNKFNYSYNGLLFIQFSNSKKIYTTIIK